AARCAGCSADQATTRGWARRRQTTGRCPGDTRPAGAPATGRRQRPAARWGRQALAPAGGTPRACRRPATAGGSCSMRLTLGVGAVLAQLLGVIVQHGVFALERMG